jgi:hypothetical protein
MAYIFNICQYMCRNGVQWVYETMLILYAPHQNLKPLRSPPTLERSVAALDAYAELFGCMH